MPSDIAEPIQAVTPPLACNETINSGSTVKIVVTVESQPKVLV